MSDFINFIIIAAKLLFMYIAAPVLVLLIVAKILQSIQSKSGNARQSPHLINTNFVPVKSEVGFIVDDIDVDLLASSTTGFAGADIANLINEAAIAAVRENKPQVEQSHIEYAWEKIIAGLPDASKVIDEQTKYRIAIHEIGHAIVATELKAGKLEKNFYSSPWWWSVRLQLNCSRR